MSGAGDELTRFGKIAIFNSGSGWNCTCEMFVTGAGVKVEVASERGHPTIETAMGECLERCIQCITELQEHEGQKRIRQGG